MKIEIKKEDYEFLKGLQRELLTQENDGNADPLYWGVLEFETVGVPDGCGEPIIYMGDGATMELEECVGYIDREYMHDMNVKARHEWAHTDKSSMSDVVDFMHQTLHWNETRIVYVEKKDKLSRETGAFLTKRAAKEYVDKYAYNHTKPRTYAMTAFRNFELERLLKILKTIKLD